MKNKKEIKIAYTCLFGYFIISCNLKNCSVKLGF